jgi:hypothetical protein
VAEARHREHIRRKVDCHCQAGFGLRHPARLAAMYLSAQSRNVTAIAVAASPTDRSCRRTATGSIAAFHGRPIARLGEVDGWTFDRAYGTEVKDEFRAKTSGFPLGSGLVGNAGGCCYGGEAVRRKADYFIYIQTFIGHSPDVP